MNGLNEAFEKPRDANQSLNDKAEKNKKVSKMDMDTLQMANLYKYEVMFVFIWFL